MWYPYGTYAALAAYIFLIFFQGYMAFLKPFGASAFVINYVLLPVFVALFAGYKLWNGTKWVKLDKMDIWTGRRVEGLNAEEEENRPEKSGFVHRVKDVAVG